ncbi:MAG: hypothetical protein H7175_17645 [Burkholderiales bacterium]|nr:hypothetical protein [Anaerolineae bacterium]
MSAIEITIKLPEELVERAQEAGLALDDNNFAAMVETELIRAQSAVRLREAMVQLQGSLTLEEIEAELAAAKSERMA